MPIDDSETRKFTIDSNGNIAIRISNSLSEGTGMVVPADDLETLKFTTDSNGNVVIRTVNTGSVATEVDPTAWHITGNQSSITGTKSGSFNLSTSGSITANTFFGDGSHLSGISPGVTDHTALSHLDYASSGHTGFQPAGSYLTAETDPIYSSWNKSSGISIAHTQVSDWVAATATFLTSFSETDTWGTVMTRGNQSNTKGIIDITDTQALLIRKVGATGDIFTVDTTNSKVIVGGSTAQIGVSGTENIISFTAGGISITGTLGFTSLASALVVSDGGTGNATFTTYMPLCGGTTATGILQQIATGTIYYPLCYNTSSSLPSFQILDVRGGGTGNASWTTARMPVLAGTTTTAGLQTVAAGTQYYPMCYNTSSTNPTFQILDVRGGGTGVVTFTTAYTILCAGTTANGVLQHMASAGSAGQMLRSGGSSALPTWSTPTYPNTATLNKYLIGDGTNWIESASAGIDATVTYVDTLLGAKTLTFTKGILTAQV